MISAETCVAYENPAHKSRRTQRQHQQRQTKSRTDGRRSLTPAQELSAALADPLGDSASAQNLPHTCRGKLALFEEGDYVVDRPIIDTGQQWNLHRLLRNLAHAATAHVVPGQLPVISSYRPRFYPLGLTIGARLLGIEIPIIAGAKSDHFSRQTHRHVRSRILKWGRRSSRVSTSRTTGRHQLLLLLLLLLQECIKQCPFGKVSGALHLTQREHDSGAAGEAGEDGEEGDAKQIE